MRMCFIYLNLGLCVPIVLSSRRPLIAQRRQSFIPWARPSARHLPLVHTQSFTLQIRGQIGLVTCSTSIKSPLEVLQWGKCGAGPRSHHEGNGGDGERMSSGFNNLYSTSSFFPSLLPPFCALATTSSKWLRLWHSYHSKMVKSSFLKCTFTKESVICGAGGRV